LTLEEDEADDLLVASRGGASPASLRAKRCAVEIQRGMSEEFLKLLVDQLELDPSNVYVNDAIARSQ